MKRTPVLIMLVLALGATLIPAAGGEEHDPCADPDHTDYASYDCRVERLRERSFVVVAVVDTGINPYHLNFRLPEDDDLHGVPPWEYIDGYPEDSEALELTFDADNYHAAVAEDAEVWDDAEWGQLYHIPGTKIIGGYGIQGTSSSGSKPVLDENGHGSSAASVAAGLIHGSAPDVDVLLVSVNGIGTAPLEWAASQPWIDIVSNSFGYVANAPLVTAGDHHIIRDAVDEGKIIAFAGGNGLSGTGVACDRGLTWTSPRPGPSWTLTVGAASPRNGQAYCWHSVPVDVSSYGRHWPSATHDSFDGERNFSGTSNATPVVAGVIAAQVLEARRAFGDRRQGPDGDGALAVAQPDVDLPETGPLADGVLTNAEVEETTVKTAYPEDFEVDRCTDDLVDCANITPTTPAYYTYMGYGIVNEESKERALRVLFGEEGMPDRSDVDQWMVLKDAVSDALWTNAP